MLRLTRLRTSAVLVGVSLALAVAVTAGPAVAVTNCTPSSSWGTNRSDLAAQVVQLINQYRAGKGLSQLAASSPLAASSTWKSLHMAGYGYFSHDDPAPPVARSAYARATDCGYGSGSWGENIAWGYTSAQSVVNGWLGSSGHKANIENPGFTSTGVGVAANANGSLYWTQSFGTDVPAAAPPPAPSPPPVPSPPPPPSPPPAPAAVPAATPAAAAAAAAAPTPLAGAAAGTPPADPVPSTTLQVGGTPARVSSVKERSRLRASVSFVQLATGRPFSSGSVRCRAEVSGRRLRVLANVFKGDAASCTWRIPRWARGKRLIGVVAVQLDETAATRLFVHRLR